MAAVAFDTYRVVKRLRDAGFDERQAEAVTTAIQDSITVDLSNLVTKDHFDERMRQVDTRFDRLEDRQDHLEKQMGHIEERLGRVEERLVRIEERFNSFETKISESKADTLKAVMNMISGAVAINVLTVLGSMFVLVKILGH